ncbi:MAG: DEAD/DEAH box helicase family protein, partial [Candidatus Marinimicrobia bacterium]|nr:DEAD/DEAH box helicase family protein [Candidatus Neomarinimicrobiota bacterium]
MAKYLTEADARIVIDNLLRKSGWDPSDKTQVRTEVPLNDPTYVKENLEMLKIQPEIYQKIDETKIIGRADYVLYDQQGRPLSVIEAKKNAFDPYSAKQQALPYAKSINAPFIFLTNGELIYFWDYTEDDARIVDSFYSRRDLERMVHMRKHKQPLAEIFIPDYYIRYGEQRKLRDYQQSVMRSLDQAIEMGKRRYLMELPTGTGKTDVIALYIKRLMDSGRSERVLFLVDREQ